MVLKVWKEERRTGSAPLFNPVCSSGRKRHLVKCYAISKESTQTSLLDGYGNIKSALIEPQNKRSENAEIMGTNAETSLSLNSSLSGASFPGGLVEVDILPDQESDASLISMQTLVKAMKKTANTCISDITPLRLWGEYLAIRVLNVITR